MTGSQGPGAANGSDTNDEGERPGAPHRLLERSRASDTWGLIAAVILGAATLATAWCSYQAASWANEAADANRDASVARFEAARQGDISDLETQSDLLIFASWIEAETNGNDVFARAIEERFRPQFVPAFEAWRALSVDGELAPGSPFDRPEYLLTGWEAEERLNLAAAEYSAEADAASQISTGYVLSAVLYASVLFLAGIASKLYHPRATRLAVALSATLLVVTLIITFARPIDLT